MLDLDSFINIQDDKLNKIIEESKKQELKIK